MKNIMENTRYIFVGVFIGFLAALIFMAGFFTRDIIDYPGNIFLPENNTYQLLSEADVLLETHYLRELPSKTSRQYAAIRGMLQSIGDRNTFFIDPPVAQSESDALAGTYGGIGVTLSRNNTGDFVLYPFEESPARDAGLQDGDVLLAINGEEVLLESSQDQIDQMTRGEVGSGNGIELTVRHANGETLTVFIEFDVINVPSVVSRILDEDIQIGYIKILRFTNRTPAEFQQAVKELREKTITAIILDLRNNGGGLLQEAIQVTDELIDGGVVSYEITSNTEKTFEVNQGGSMTDLPLVVLVNDGTASASELLAGAIADRDRGILIGQQTFGKGTIQQIFSLSDQSSIHITSAEWLTPNRNAIDGQGITPTIPMIPDENGRDVEIGEAISYLRAELQKTSGGF